MIVSKEGKIFVYPLFIATAISAFTYLNYGISIYFLLGLGVIFFFCLNFFRDPKRLVPKGDNQIVSPADGKIIRIERIDDDEFGDSQLISIFLSIFNVHANRMPIDGSFLGVKYEKGKFLMAFDHKACDENERNSITIMTGIGPIRLVQVAGLLARRIICYAKVGESMKIGSRLGFMRFGSRIDLIIPSTVKLNVELGQKVMGNSTIIGTF
jgi:phosphatidylserine decarboxylase